MIWVRGLEQWSASGRPLYLALGNFDGVHRGHQLVIKRTVELARRRGGFSALLVFNPHPRAFFNREPFPPLLTGLQDKAEIIAALGIDYFIVEPFNRQLADTAPEQFVNKYLWEKLKVSGVVIGEDYTFGRAGRGTPPLMRRLGREYGFQVEICPLWKDEEENCPVSSSSLRELISRGRVRRASRLLNYYFFRYGEVVTGAGRGERLLYPTANLRVSPALLWPARGVYFTAVEGAVGDKIHFGVTNVGGTPTFRQEAMTVETHVLNFYGDLYHKKIKIYFLERLRPVISFAGAEDLKKQIARDIAEAERRAKSAAYRPFRRGFLETAGRFNRISP